MPALNLNELKCYGCSHSAATAPYPSRPSGERPCCFCVRNPMREAELARAAENHPDWFNGSRAKEQGGVDYNPYTGHWYDGSKAVRVPMDCYHSLDMLDQIEMWQRSRRLNENDGPRFG